MAADAEELKPGGTLRATLLTGNVLWLSVVSLLNDLASEMIFPLLPIFLVGTLGAGPRLLGVIEGVAESTASLMKLVGGWISDRIGRRKSIVVWGYGVATIARPLVALAAAPWHVLAIRFSDRVGKGIRTAPRDALLAASVDDAWRGRAFGLHRAADHLGALAGPLLASLVLLLAPGRLRLVFALALVPGLIALAVLLLLVRERVDDPAAARTRTSDQDASVDARPRLHRPMLPYLAVLVLFTLGNASDAFLLLRAADLGVPVAAVPLLWSALHVSKSGWSIVGGWLADRIGPAHSIVAGWIVYAAVYAGFAVASDAWHAWALFLAYGLFHGLSEAPEKVLVARLAPPARVASAFGAYHFAIGLAALPASLLFGALWQAFGAPVAFFAGTAIALLAALALPLALRRT